MAAALRVAILGIQGFVGSAFARVFRDEGHVVTPLPRIPHAQLVQWSAGQLPAADLFPDGTAAVEGVDAVINCAGKILGNGEDPHAGAVNETLPAALYSHCLAAGVPSFVHLSSVAAIGSITPPGRPFGDDTEPAPTSAYGWSKLRGDRALIAAEQPGTRAVVLRPPLIYGAGVSGIFAAFMRAAGLRLPLPLSGLRNRRNFMFVDNLALAALAAVRSPDVRCAYIVTDSPAVTPGELYDAIAAAKGIGRLSWRLPRALVDPIARTLLQDRAPSLLCDAEYDSMNFRRASGWSPAFGLEEGLARTV